jgi:hypothetical protein
MLFLLEEVGMRFAHDSNNVAPLFARPRPHFAYFELASFIGLRNTRRLLDPKILF